MKAFLIHSCTFSPRFSNSSDSYTVHIFSSTQPKNEDRETPSALRVGGTVCKVILLLRLQKTVKRRKKHR
jgi:hypothetical protein